MRKLNDFELEQVSGGSGQICWIEKDSSYGIINVLLGMGIIGLGICQLVEHYKKESK